MYGMTAEQFWYGDPRLATAYRKYYEIKQDCKNADMWWQGFYIYEGMHTVHYNENRRKGQKAISYPVKPHELKKKPEDPKAQKEMERQKAIDSFNRQLSVWRSVHKDKK